MSKMKEIDSIAQGVADHCWEILYDQMYVHIYSFIALLFN